MIRTTAPFLKQMIVALEEDYFQLRNDPAAPKALVDGESETLKRLTFLLKQTAPTPARNDYIAPTPTRLCGMSEPYPSAYHEVQYEDGEPDPPYAEITQQVNEEQQTTVSKENEKPVQPTAARPPAPEPWELPELYGRHFT